jgi:hypothetical protein
MATYTTTDARNQVKRVLRDESAVTDERLLIDGNVDVFVTQAAARYSLDNPRQVAEDITADGTSVMALPSGWVSDFSDILSIESPLDQQPPMYLDRRDWEFYQTPSGLKVRWTRLFQPSGRVVRVLYTATRAYNASAASTTIPDNHHFAVCDLAVSICADAISMKYARAHEPVLNADITNYQDRARVWADIARRYEQRYRDAVRVTDTPKAASQFLNWDVNPSPAREYIFHRKENR